MVGWRSQGKSKYESKRSTYVTRFVSKRAVRMPVLGSNNRKLVIPSRAVFQSKCCYLPGKLRYSFVSLNNTCAVRCQYGTHGERNTNNHVRTNRTVATFEVIADGLDYPIGSFLTADSCLMDREIRSLENSKKRIEMGN